MSKYNQCSQKKNSGMKSEDRENVFHHANSIISHSNQKEVNNGIKIEESNKTNGNVSASREIMDKLRYLSRYYFVLQPILIVNCTMKGRKI